MQLKRKRFKNRKVGNFKQYNGFFDLFGIFTKISFLIKTVFVIFCLGAIFFVSGFVFDYGRSLLKDFSKATLKIASENMGQEMDKDELGQINVLLAGYGGGDHQGNYLTDTMMVASFNPKLGTVSFLSVPRDLWVEYENNRAGRLNFLFYQKYYRSESEDDKAKLDEAALALSKKMTEITGIEISYYALIDFQGLVTLVDKLGGVDIDVPEAITDYKYPTIDGGYQTFKIEEGIQHLDGETALKYARSRYSTSDFSRALRQQQIIKGVVTKVTSAENILNISKLQELYGQYNKVVNTNIGFKQILGMAKYMDKLDKFYSFVLTADCDETSYQTISVGCFLYYPQRALFGGASVLLPEGATDSNVSYYNKIQDFAFFVMYNQGFLKENVGLNILNGIDLKVIKKKYKYSYPVASEIAIKFKKYGFNITDVANTPKDPTTKTKKIYDKSIIFINGEGDYTDTINLIKIFVEIDEIKKGDPKYGDGITLILGNSYLDM